MTLTKEQAHWDWWNKVRRTGHLESDDMFLAVRMAVLKELETFGPPIGKLLEVACGTGWFSELVTGKYKYTGLDIGPESIEIAKSQHPWASFLCEDFLVWDTTETFDVTVFIDAIALFRNQDVAMAKIHNVMTPGGYVILSTVNPIVYSRLSWIGPPAEGQARKWLSRSELTSLLVRNCFEVVHTYTVYPSGDKGFLRWVNNWRLHKLLIKVIPEQWLKKMKESVGLGAVRIAVARKI